MKDVIGLYNKKRSVFAHSRFPCKIIKSASFEHKKTAAVIPACAEYPNILSTFESLQALEYAPSVICVVNHRANASGEVKENNRTLVKEAPKYGVCVLDCSEPEFEFEQNEGVGTARRIGMDYALLSGAHVIACMDADTSVSVSYGPAVQDFFERCEFRLNGGKFPFAGAVTGFTHQAAENRHLQTAIDAYEFFIKEHSRRLFKTGTPFYPYALGPSIVCSAWGYAASGGMNKRISGEDFYFLQSLIKVAVQQAAVQPEESAYAGYAGLCTFCTDGTLPEKKLRRFVFPELDCTVFPQARLSKRTLFGTGQRLAALTENAENSKNTENTENSAASIARDSLVYPDEVYKKIEDFIALFYKTAHKPELFFNECAQCLDDVYDFLAKERFFDVWEKMLIQNRKNIRKLEAAFHTWFDGLKILRLIHYLMR
ncbi:glycosyltransferase [Treponema sp. OMZ 840]|uniref:glycosyltransferase n=1 Tax=Treponema sp. OMZ 840 TaxID=244313 RepID=UPI003D8CCEB2